MICVRRFSKIYLSEILVSCILGLLIILFIGPVSVWAQCPTGGQSVNTGQDPDSRCFTCDTDPQPITAVSSPIPVTATFTGGFSSACLFGYTTKGDSTSGCGKLSREITVSFSAGVSFVIMRVDSFFPGIISATANNGNSFSEDLTLTGGTTFVFPGTGISNIKIASSAPSWFFTIKSISFTPDPNLFGTAGPLFVNPKTADAGTPLTVTGQNWLQRNGSKFQLFLDGTLVNGQGPLTCTEQPAMTFNACGSPGTHTITCKTMDAFTQQIIASNQTTITITGAGGVCTPACLLQAGRVTVNPNAGSPGTTVTITGSGWSSDGSANREYRTIFDGFQVARQLISSCAAQPDMSFNVPCEAIAGIHNVAMQLADSASGQVLLNLDTITFEVTASKVSAAAAINCPVGTTVTLTPLKVIPRGKTAFITADVNPSPSNTPITLTLSTKAGTTGKAVFAKTGTTTMTIDRDTTIEIKGISESSVMDNIELKAMVNNQVVDVEPFCVLYVNLVPVKTSGPVATNNAGLSEFINCTKFKGNLGFILVNGNCKKVYGTAVQIEGKVMPKDFDEPIVIGRKVDFSVYGDSMPLDSQVNMPDTSKSIYRDDIAKDSNGSIYDLDAPGIIPKDGTTPGAILRIRQSFTQFAIYGGRVDESTGIILGGQQVSNDLFWHSYVSVKRVTPTARDPRTDIPDTTYPGDNSAGSGPGVTTFNLLK